MVKKGIIKESHISGDLFSEKSLQKINTQLIGLRHEKKVIQDLINKKSDITLNAELSLEKLVNHFF
jgi:hypothetical protein